MSALRITRPDGPSRMMTPDHQPIHIMPVPLLDGEPVRQRTNKPETAVFRRRAMYKYELASWYGVSRNHFASHYLPPVLSQLRKKGYTAQTRLLSLAMVNIICEFHDEPGQ